MGGTGEGTEPAQWLLGAQRERLEFDRAQDLFHLMSAGDPQWHSVHTRLSPRLPGGAKGRPLPKAVRLPPWQLRAKSSRWKHWAQKTRAHHSTMSMQR